MLFCKDTAGAAYFSDANEDTMPTEALLWKRIQNNTKSFAEIFFVAEQTMLDHPEFVFFAPLLAVESDLVNYPCKISATSKILARVSFNDFVNLKFNFSLFPR